jgi:hypothetical protein
MTTNASTKNGYTVRPDYMGLIDILDSETGAVVGGCPKRIKNLKTAVRWVEANMKPRAQAEREQHGSQ